MSTGGTTSTAAEADAPDKNKRGQAKRVAKIAALCVAGVVVSWVALFYLIWGLASLRGPYPANFVQTNASPVDWRALRTAEQAERRMSSVSEQVVLDEWDANDLADFQAVCLQARRGVAIRTMWDQMRLYRLGYPTDLLPRGFLNSGRRDYGPWQQLFDEAPKFRKIFSTFGPHLWFTFRWPVDLGHDDTSWSAGLADAMLTYDHEQVVDFLDSKFSESNIRYTVLRGELMAATEHTIRRLERTDSVLGGGPDHHGWCPPAPRLG